MLVRALLLVACVAVGLSGQSFSSLYFFGDSLTDTGNVLKATSSLNGLFPLYPAAPYYDGRFSNGPVWAEYAAERLGQPGAARAAGLSMGIFGQLGGEGNNYAIGGARTGTGGALGSLDLLIPTGMTSQVRYYLVRTGGTADPAALYFLFGGGNDLREAARISDPARRAEVALEAASQIAFALRDLYMAGARQFVVVNSPDVGLIPEMISAGVTEPATDASVRFNDWLALYGHYLRSEVPGIMLYEFDLFALHRELVAKYGTGAVRPCISEPAGTCSQTLFFDNIHPTGWVHEMIGSRVAEKIAGGT